jgi:peptide/nickel transport system permease protein
VIVLVLAVLVVNFLVDVAYTVLDPRLRRAA